MMLGRYVLFALVAVFLKAFQFLLGWLLIAPFVQADGNLPSLFWLRLLFQPDDTPAIGDEMFGSREMAHTATWRWKWAARWWRATQWGMRNPAYGWDSNVCGMRVFAPYSFTISGNKNIDIGYDGNGTCIAVLGSVFRTCIDDGREYFEWKFAFSWPGNRYACMCSFGWNLGSVFKFGQVRNLRIDIRPRISLT